jgi:hypothetical protein
VKSPWGVSPSIYVYFHENFAKHLRVFSLLSFVIANIINGPLYYVFTFKLRAKVHLYACGSAAYCLLIQGYSRTQELSARVSRINHKRNSPGRLEF